MNIVDFLNKSACQVRRELAKAERRRDSAETIQQYCRTLRKLEHAADVAKQQVKWSSL